MISGERASSRNFLRNHCFEWQLLLFCVIQNERGQTRVGKIPTVKFDKTVTKQRKVLIYYREKVSKKRL